MVLTKGTDAVTLESEALTIESDVITCCSEPFMFTSVLRPHRTTAVFAAAPRAPKLVRMIVIPVILLVVAVVVAVVAGLAWSAKLPGNAYVGIRAPEARKSKENWDITHRVAGPPWAVSALAFAGAAALAFLAIRPEASGWMWLWVAVAGLLGLAMLGVGGWFPHDCALRRQEVRRIRVRRMLFLRHGRSAPAAAAVRRGGDLRLHTAGTANPPAPLPLPAPTRCTPTEAADPSCCSTDASADATSAAANQRAPRPRRLRRTGGCGSAQRHARTAMLPRPANACTVNGTAVDRDALRRVARTTV